MRYDQPELQDALAAEYVLGTLRGPARRRFERLMIERANQRERVHWWEQRLNTLTTEITPEQPPLRVWTAIQRRISPAGPQRAAWFGAWPIAALLASAASVILAVYIVLTPVATEPEYLALIENDSGQPVWSVAADIDTNRLQARAVGEPTAPEGRVLELWLMPPAAGNQPRSLGLLPTSGSIRHDLDPDLLASAGAQAGVAVSVEPRGGSPTGLPTGPVVYQGALVRL